MHFFSPALGQGWRVGFLGLLHLEVFTQRLFQEHKAEAILTAPSVPYKIKYDLLKYIFTVSHINDVNVFHPPLKEDSLEVMLWNQETSMNT